MADLQDKVVVVTGAAGGQGLAEARALADSGAWVVACDRMWPTNEPVADEGRTLYRDLDVSEPETWAKLAAELAERFGAVHGLVNNAGIALRSRLGEVELAAWNRVFAVNVTGPMLGIQALAPLMPRGSSIVNVGSLAALTGHAAVAYTASKWALRGLTRTASMHLGDAGIRVNAIHPGFIETPMTAAAPDVFRQANLANTPLGRAGIVDDIAPLVLFLLSTNSAYITGAEIPVDGGQSGHAGAKILYDTEREATR